MKKEFVKGREDEQGKKAPNNRGRARIGCQCNGYSGPVKPFMVRLLLREQCRLTCECEETFDQCTPRPQPN